jgi:hypothetical protein
MRVCKCQAQHHYHMAIDSECNYPGREDSFSWLLKVKLRLRMVKWGSKHHTAMNGRVRVQTHDSGAHGSFLFL